MLNQSKSHVVSRTGPNVPDAAQLFDGTCAVMEFHPGFGIHTLNATARRRFEVDAMRKPGMILHCFLEGNTQARLDGEDLDLGRRDGRCVKLVLTRANEARRFWRLSREGEYVRKVNINMSFSWLDAAGLGACSCPERMEWDLCCDEVRRFERLVQLASDSTPLGRLEAESLALGVVAETMHHFDDTSAPTQLSPTDVRRMARMEAFIRDSGEVRLSLGDIAQAGHVSVSTMRRLFSCVHRLSVQHYVRNIRLDAARRALTEKRVPVAEAARIAGYGSPANFATAFRRAYGVTPTGLRSKSH